MCPPHVDIIRTFGQSDDLCPSTIQLKSSKAPRLAWLTNWHGLTHEDAWILFMRLKAKCWHNFSQEKILTWFICDTPLRLHASKGSPQLIRTHKHTSVAAALFPEHQYCKLLHSCIICTDIARSGAACNSVPPPSLYLARLVCVCAQLPPTAASSSSSYSYSSSFPSLAQFLRLNLVTCSRNTLVLQYLTTAIFEYLVIKFIKNSIYNTLIFW